MCGIQTLVELKFTPKEAQKSPTRKQETKALPGLEPGFWELTLNQDPGFREETLNQNPK